MSVKEFFSRVLSKTGRITKNIRQKLRGQRGYVMILVAFFIPVLFMGVQYVVKKTQLGQRYLVRTNAINRLGDSIIRAYNPSVDFSEQKDVVYAAAAQTLNDSAFKLFKQMLLKEANNTEDIQLYRNVVSIPVENKPYSRILYDLSFGQLRKSQDPKIREMFADEFSKQRLLTGSNFIDSVRLDSDACHITYFATTAQSGQEPVIAKFFKPYIESPDALELSLNSQNRTIIARSSKINREVIAHLPECNINIIVAIPTNHEACCSEAISDISVKGNTNSTRTLTVGTKVVTKIDSSTAPISVIARSCGKFLDENFSHTYGVAVGVIPYSGKVSLDPDVATARTCDMKSFDLLKIESAMRTTSSDGSSASGALKNGEITYSYWKQAAAYSTVGKVGAVLDENNTNETDGWNNDKVGTAIMYRRGSFMSWNTLTLYSGSNGGTGTASLLLSNESPASDNLKYIRMPLNPCYLGHCNLTGNVCEKDCPVYMENPYYIYELTDNMAEITYYLKFFTPFEDKYNKSNFIFLPLHWAGNLLANWTKYPTGSTGKLAHPARNKKRNFVVIIVNKPSTFEPHEMTYLGFDNDNAEMPISESDVIAFKQTAKTLNISAINAKTEWESAKGLIKIQKLAGSTWDFREAEGGLRCSGKFKLVFANKNLISLKLKDAISRVQIYGDNRPKGEHIGEHLMVADTSFKFSGPKNFISETGVVLTSDTRNINSFSTTGGINFGHNLGTYKLSYKLEGSKVKDATLSNQVLRCYAHYKYNSHESGFPSILLNNERHCQAVTNAAAERYTDPCISTQFNNGFRNEFSFYTPNPQFAQVRAYNFHPACYGMRHGYFVMTSYVPNSGMDMSDGYLTQESSSGSWIRLSRNSSVTGQINKSSSNAYQVYPLIANPRSNDCVRIFTGRLHEIASCKFSPWTWRRYKYPKLASYIEYYYVNVPYTASKTEWKMVKHKKWGWLWYWKLEKVTTYYTAYRKELRSRVVYYTTTGTGTSASVDESNPITGTLTSGQTKKFVLPYSRISTAYCLNKYHYKTDKCAVKSARATNVLAVYYPYTSHIDRDFDDGGTFNNDCLTMPYTFSGYNTRIETQSTITGYYKNWIYKAFRWTSFSDSNIALLAGNTAVSSFTLKHGWLHSGKTLTCYLNESWARMSCGTVYSYKRYGFPNSFSKISVTHSATKNPFNINYMKVDNGTIESAKVSNTGTSGEGDISYFGRGNTEVTVQAGELPYLYHLNNFFFINTEKKSLYTSLNENNLYFNKGVYLDERKASDNNKEGWVRFCGDGYLRLTFGPDPDSKFIKFEDIADLDFNKLGISTKDGIGESLCQKGVQRKILGETELFVIPEQVAVYDKESKNYSITVQISNCILKEIGISNRPYYLVTPEVQMFGVLPATPANINSLDISNQDEVSMSVMREKGANFNNATDPEKVKNWASEGLIKVSALKETSRRGFAVFKTNVKKAFKIKVYVPIGWFDDDARLDWREDTTTENDKLVLYTNYNDQSIPVQLEVTSPYMGDLAPTLSVTDTRYLEGDGPFECTINSQHRLTSVKIRGLKQYLGRAYYGFTATYTPRYTAETSGNFDNDKTVTLSYTNSAIKYTEATKTFPEPYLSTYNDSKGIEWYEKLTFLDNVSDAIKNTNASQHIFGRFDKDSTYSSTAVDSLASAVLTEQYEKSTSEAKKKYDEAKHEMEQSQAQNALAAEAKIKNTRDQLDKAETAKNEAEQKKNEAETAKTEAEKNINNAKETYVQATEAAVDTYNTATNRGHKISNHWKNWTPSDIFSWPIPEITEASEILKSSIQNAQKAYKDVYDANKSYVEAYENAKVEYDAAEKAYTTAKTNYEDAVSNKAKNSEADPDKKAAYKNAKDEYDSATSPARETAESDWKRYQEFDTSKKEVAEKKSKIRLLNNDSKDKESGKTYTANSYSFQVGKDTDSDISTEDTESTENINTSDTDIVSDQLSTTKYGRDLSGHYAHSDVWAQSYEALKIQHNYIKNCKLTYGLDDICNGPGESISGVLNISATPSHDKCDVSTLSKNSEESETSIYVQKDRAIFQVNATPSCQRKYLPVQHEDPYETEARQYNISDYIKDYSLTKTKYETDDSNSNQEEIPDTGNENFTEQPIDWSEGAADPSKFKDMDEIKNNELEEDKRPEAAYKDYNEQGDVVATYIPVVDSSTGELTGEKVGTADTTVAEGKSVVALDAEPSELVNLGMSYEQDVKRSDGEDLQEKDWDGAFGVYFYKGVKLPKNLFELSVSGTTIYNGGMIDGIEIPASSQPEVADDVALGEETLQNSEENISNNKVEDSNENASNKTVNYTDITPPTEMTSTPGVYSKELSVSNCFIGSRVERDGIVDCTVINQGHDGEKTEIEISPTNYDFIDVGNGWYLVVVPCENVIISDPEMLDRAKTLQVHGYDVGEAVQLVDYENQYASLGAIQENIRNGSDGAWSYKQVVENRYWCLQPANLTARDTVDTLDLSPTSSRILSKYVESYIDEANGIITATNDFFAEFWDHEMTAPGLSIKFGEHAPSKILGTEFGSYDTLFSFSGSPLIFFPYNTFNIGNDGCKFVFSGTGIPMAAVYTGFTMPYNFALANNGYQTSSGARATVKPYPSEALKNLSRDACEKLNATVYVIKYGEAAKDVNELDQCRNVVTFSANNETELIDVLRDISKDIKDKTGTTSGYTEINLLKEKEIMN